MTSFSLLLTIISLSRGIQLWDAEDWEVFILFRYFVIPRVLALIAIDRIPASLIDVWSMKVETSAARKKKDRTREKDRSI